MSTAVDAKVVNFQGTQNQNTVRRKTFEPPYKAQRFDTKTIGLELQKSIELDTVLRNFNAELNARIPWCTLLYDNHQLDMHCLFGKNSLYSCCYRLEIEGQYLGDLSFSKLDKFSKRDVTLIENLLCALIYPLRNALKYYRALRYASTDSLTGLGNRFAFDQAMDREINIAQRHKSALTLLMLDVDFFKRVNDVYGHQVGDEVLQKIGQVIRLIARGSDLAFRYGGEEFAILLSNTDVNGATLFAERLRIAIEQLDYEHQDSMLKTTVSIGVAEFRHADSSNELLKKADHALYEAKASGRNRVISAASD